MRHEPPSDLLPLYARHFVVRFAHRAENASLFILRIIKIDAFGFLCYRYPMTHSETAVRRLDADACSKPRVPFTVSTERAKLPLPQLVSTWGETFLSMVLVHLRVRRVSGWHSFVAWSSSASLAAWAPWPSITQFMEASEASV
jgi:hypothetical protein